MSRLHDPAGAARSSTSRPPAWTRSSRSNSSTSAKRRASEGRTVFISSHQLPEVEHLCDRVGIIREGRLLAVESIASLKERALRRLEIDFGGTVPAEAFADAAGRSRPLHRRRDAPLHRHGHRSTRWSRRRRGIEVCNLRSVETSLEEIFLAYYGAGDGVTAIGTTKEASHAAA